MDTSSNFEGTLRYVQARWPLYLFGYGGGAVLVLVAVWLGLRQGWLALIPLALAAILILTYFFAASLWSAHQLYDNTKIRDKLFDLGGFRPDEKFVYLDVGLKWLPISLSRRLTTGRILVIDLYNPNLTPGSSLVRAHRQTTHPQSDPRLSWRDGNITLLPLPDHSVPVIVLSEVISEFWQQGDRERLMEEICRILAPGGRLILAERVRTPTSILMMGLAGLRLEPGAYWQQLITRAGLRIKREEILEDLIYFCRADKPQLNEGQQLFFDF
jgi:SAM-dependent methyltransferase